MAETPPQNKTTLIRPRRAARQQEEEKKERIKTWMAVLLFVVALFVDITNIVPVIGHVIVAVAYFAFWIWFKFLDVSFVKNPKNLGALGIGALIEMIASFLPGFTASIVTVILITRAEDKGGIIGKAASMAQGKIKT